MVTEEQQKVNRSEDKKQQIHKYLTWFFKQDHLPKTFVIPDYLIHVTGRLDGALFLSQLLYWMDKGGRDDGYFYKTKKQWVEETLIPDSTLRKLEAIFIEKGWIQTKVIKAYGKPTVHYKINDKKLVNDIYDVCTEKGITVSKDYGLKTMNANMK